MPEGVAVDSEVRSPIRLLVADDHDILPDLLSATSALIPWPGASLRGSWTSTGLRPASIALAKWYAKKTGYTYNDSWDYSGTATKWFEETYQKPAITVEITDRFKSDWTINKSALLELISQ